MIAPTRLLDSRLNGLKQIIEHYRPLANQALLSNALSSVIDFSLLFDYLFGYRETSYVYETELLHFADSNQPLQKILQLGYDMIQKDFPNSIRPEGVIQFWYYSVTSSSLVLDESNEVSTDNERFRSLHLYSDSEDEIDEPSEVITFLLVVHRDHTVHGGYVANQRLDEGVYHILSGNEPYCVSQVTGEGSYQYIKIMYPCMNTSKDK